ncbi:MAG: recombinase family protein, partial [Eubacteriales bacterium]|nr:recombinase family protein [Eubacteriales bacterium]
GYVRELKSLNPPVEVFFETENIHTLNSNSEMSLSFIATLAQEESHTKSEIMNASISMRFNRGIFLTPTLLGYDKDEDGNLVINEEEAIIVRLIFYMYLFGYSPKEIADTLTECGSKTKKGNTEWSTSSIMQILQNERHCGDILARKTFTPNYLDHKSKKNNGELTKYYQRDHHDAIISHEIFTAVQKIIRGSKYGGRGILPELHVIEDGILSGYVVVNTKWAAFKAQDYIDSYVKVFGDPPKEITESIEVEGKEGEFDLRGFEIARSQFFSTKGQNLISLTGKNISYSTTTIHRFDKKLEIELLVHPITRKLAIRPAPENSKYKVKWGSYSVQGLRGRTVSGSAYLPTLYELFGWNIKWKYQLVGTFLQNGNDYLLTFDSSEAVVLVPPEVVTKEQQEIQPISQGKRIEAYPNEWGKTFGENYYLQATSAPSKNGPGWNVSAEGTPVYDPELNISSPIEMQNNIEALMRKLKKEEQDHE